MLEIKTKSENNLVTEITIEHQDGAVEAKGVLEISGVWDVKIQYSGRTVSKCFSDVNSVIAELVGFMSRYNAMLTQDAAVNLAEEVLDAANSRYTELSDAHHKAVFQNGSWA